MRHFYGWLFGVFVALGSLTACGGGGGTTGEGVEGADTGDTSSTNLNAHELSVVGSWRLAGFDLYDYPSGRHLTQNAFVSWSGALGLHPDKTMNFSLCINGSCGYGEASWGIQGETFVSNGAGVPFQFDGTTLVLDYDKPTEGFRETKYYVRAGAAPMTAHAAASSNEAPETTDALAAVRDLLGR